MAGALTGIRVLDLGSYIAGPYGSTLLADLGADVIKVESPEGDPVRRYPSTLAGESRAFLGVNRGKRGIVLDLKQEDGRAVLMRLVERADVLIHSMRPAVPRRLGIDYKHLRVAHPRLIYCALSGYGSTGPLRDKPGYDQVLQSFTGIAALQGDGHGGPEIVLGSVVDFYAAALIAYGVSAALYRRERTGMGQRIDLSLLQAALAMQSQRLIWAEGETGDEGRDMRSGGVTGIYAAREGHLYISANTPHFWQALCEVLGLPHLARDERFDSIRKRAAHAAELRSQIQERFLERSALEWEQRLGEQVPCSAVRRIEEMFDHPQVSGSGWVRAFDHPTLGSYRGLAHPIDFPEEPAAAPRAAPTLGEHSRAVLGELGYSPAEIESLVANGTIR